MEENSEHSPDKILILSENTRKKLWSYLTEEIENYLAGVVNLSVTPELDIEEIHKILSPFDFSTPRDPFKTLELIVSGLWEHQVHTPHPAYFGLFNPAPSTMGIVADTLVATLNPQLAAWSHSPLAVEIEQHMIQFIGSCFGYQAETIDGTFTSGGAEANHTALLTALVEHFPEYATKGLRALAAQPVFYLSEDSHHSWVKAARFCGLGTESIQVFSREEMQQPYHNISARIRKDKEKGFAPFLIVGTAGTTNSGEIEPLEKFAQIASEEKLWFHVDAAWGGGVIFTPQFFPLLKGIEQADSITFDAHKWLSVPMAAGIYLTRHPKILTKTCGIHTNYMPIEAAEMEVIDPYAHSLQWSRRFIGLKVFLSLAVAGKTGYEQVIQHQISMGELLRQKLLAAGWEIMNQTLLPVVCFKDSEQDHKVSATFLESILKEVLDASVAWISITTLANKRTALRACITNYRTTPKELDVLIDALEKARAKIIS